MGPLRPTQNRHQNFQPQHPGYNRRGPTTPVEDGGAAAPPPDQGAAAAIPQMLTSRPMPAPGWNNQHQQFPTGAPPQQPPRQPQPIAYGSNPAAAGNAPMPAPQLQQQPQMYQRTDAEPPQQPPAPQPNPTGPMPAPMGSARPMQVNRRPQGL